jgi:hypothetical protein
VLGSNTFKFSTEAEMIKRAEKEPAVCSDAVRGGERKPSLKASAWEMTDAKH